MSQTSFLPAEVVVADLETTGLDNKHDRIIEVGLVKLRFDAALGNYGVVDSYQSLVNPGQSLEPLITDLTGISDAMLVDAPGWESIREQVQDWISGLPLIGHNVGFDSGFLRAQGVVLGEVEWDTYLLASMLVRDAGSHSLEFLSEHLALELENHHRALADAEATGQLFMALFEKLKQLPARQQAQLQALPWFEQWDYASLCQQAWAAGQPDEQDFYHISDSSPDANSEITTAEPITFGSGVSLLEIPGEQPLREAVMQTAAVSAEPLTVVVKDTRRWPELSARPEVVEFPPALAVLSLARLRRFAERPDLDQAAMGLVAKILVRLPWAEDGQKGAFNISWKESALWDELHADHPLARRVQEEVWGQTCFLKRLNQQLSQAPVVLTSQATWWAQQAALQARGGRTLLAEAGQLEETVTRALTTSLDEAQAYQWLAGFGRKEHGAWQGLLGEVAESTSEEMAKAIFLAVEDIHHAHKKFWRACRDLLATELSVPGLEQERGRVISEWMQRRELTAGLRSTQPWQSCREAVQSLGALLQQLIAAINAVPEPGEPAAWFDELCVDRERIERWAEGLQAFMVHGETPQVRLITLNPKTTQVRLELIPAAVNQNLAKCWQAADSTVLLDTCLSLDDEGAWLGERLGLKGTPFDDRVVPSCTVAFPDAKGLGQDHAQLLQQLQVWSERFPKLLVLFGSYRDLSDVYDFQMQHATPGSTPVEAQNLTGGRRKLLHRFRQAERSIKLLTLYNFLNFPVPPEDLDGIVLMRVPFPVFGDPLVQARMRQYANGFGDYLLPAALLRFGALQAYVSGSGRNKLFACLDERLFTKPYGRDFLDRMDAR